MALSIGSGCGCALAWNWPSLLYFFASSAGGHWRLVGASSDVYSGNCSREMARKIGRIISVQCRVWHLVAYFSNYLIALTQRGPTEWRWDLGVAAFPAALFFVMLFTIPRSPRWLVKKGRMSEARTVLQMTGDENYEQDLQEIVESIDMEQKQAPRNCYLRKYAFPIFLAVSIGLFNQLSGINAILYYLNDIFAHAGFSRMSGNFRPSPSEPPISFSP